MRLLQIFLPLFAATIVGCGCSSSRDPPEGSEVAKTQLEPGADSATGILLGSDFDSIIERAREVYYRGEFGSVRALVDPLLQLARASSDTASEARILMLLGQAAFREWDLTRARELNEAALELKLKIGLQRRTS